MTAPVEQIPGEDGHRVAFVMPQGRDLDTLPPTDNISTCAPSRSRVPRP